MFDWKLKFLVGNSCFMNVGVFKKGGNDSLQDLIEEVAFERSERELDWGIGAIIRRLLLV
jgi:hypothetical protein